MLLLLLLLVLLPFTYQFLPELLFSLEDEAVSARDFGFGGAPGSLEDSSPFRFIEVITFFDTSKIHI